jgi:hypothetical protein
VRPVGRGVVSMPHKIVSVAANRQRDGVRFGAAFGKIRLPAAVPRFTRLLWVKLGEPWPLTTDHC